MVAPAAPEGRLEIGRIIKPHGIRGEVVVAPVTNRPERFEPGAVHHGDDRELVVARARPHQGRWIVAYEQVADRNAAEDLRDVVLTADPDADAPGGELWVHELVGATVVDAAGVARGRVVEVEVNPAHDLLVLDTGPLVPVVFVTGFEDGVVSVDTPVGLFGEGPDDESGE